MIVNINETRSENQPFGIQGWFTRLWREFAHGNDSVSGDADVCAIERSARAVGDLRVQNQQTVRRFLGVRGKKRCTPEKQQSNKNREFWLYHSCEGSFSFLREM